MYIHYKKKYLDSVQYNKKEDAYKLYYIIYIYFCHGCDEMRNIVPRVGIEPIYMAFRPSVLTITQCRLPDITTIPNRTCLCSSLPGRSVQPITLSIIVC